MAGSTDNLRRNASFVAIIAAIFVTAIALTFATVSLLARMRG
jgi:hypothetical protein